jgi:hypothetical protein
MASRGDIEAGKAYVTTYVKNSQLVKGLNVVKQELQSLGTSVMKIGGLVAAAGSAITAPIGAAVNQFVSMGSELSNISRRTGVGVQALAEFKHAAEQTGASLGDVEGASKSVTKQIADAAMGGQGAAIALSRLGLTAEGLKKQLPEGQLQTVADRLNGIKDPAQRAALAAQLLGNTNLLPMISQLGALRKEARDLGLAPSEKAVADAANMGRMIKRSLSAVSAAIFEIGAAVAPVLFPIGEAVIRITSSVTRWVRENQEVVRTVFKIGSIIAAVGAGITAVGAAIFGIGTAFGMVATVITGIVGFIGTLITVATTIGSLLAPILLPLALVAAAVAGVTMFLLRSQTAWNAVTTTAKSALDSVVQAIAPYVEIVKTTIGGIVDALMSGDIAAAGAIAMAGLRVAFETAKLFIIGSWLDLKNRILAVWDSIAIEASAALAFIGSIFSTVMTAIAQTDFARSLSGQWIVFRMAAVSAFEYIISYARGVITVMGAIRKLIGQTVQDVAIAAPVVAEAAIKAGLGPEAQEAVGVAKMGLDMVLARANQAAQEARDGASDTRDEARKAREGQADQWKAAQQEVIRINREDLDRRAAAAKAQRDELKRGGAGDVKAGGPAGGDVVSGVALRQGFGTFSAVALGLGGSDGGVAKRQLRAQEEQRDLQKKNLEVADKQLRAVDQLNNALMMG